MKTDRTNIYWEKNSNYYHAVILSQQHTYCPILYIRLYIHKGKTFTLRELVTKFIRNSNCNHTYLIVFYLKKYFFSTSYQRVQ